MNLWTPTYVIGGCLVLAAVIHLLAAYMSRRGQKKQIAQLQTDLQEEQVSNNWLQTIAIREANSIPVVARVLDCTLLYKDMDTEAPYVNFNFHLINISVYTVCIERDIYGWVDFAGRRLGGHVKRTDANGDIPHGQGSYVVITQWLSKEDVAMIRTSNQQCAFTFKNLDLWIKGADQFAHDHQVIRGKLEITCHIERIGQGVLDDDSETETKWLTDIARDQAETIYRFVHPTMVQCGNHELLREHPYIEFVIAVDNRSLYDITFDDLLGAISFAGRELTEQPTWQTRLEITHGNTGSVTIRERLTEGDVTKILNGSPGDQFDFSRLEIKVIGNHNLSSTPLHTHHLALTNKTLLPVYPKLEINISQACYDWIIALGTQARFNIGNPCYVTLILDIKNRRPVALEVETFKLSISVNGKDYAAFADDGSDVHPHRYIADEGFEAVGAQSFPNLNHAIPLVCREDMPVSGALQFVFNELDFGDFLNDLDAVDDAQFTLLVVDKKNEKHPQQGLLTRRNKVASLFSG